MPQNYINQCPFHGGVFLAHYNDVIMSTIASQMTSLTIVYSTVYSDADQRKHQSSASLAFVRGIHRGPVNSPHKWPVTRKMFPFDDVIMNVWAISILVRDMCFVEWKTRPPNVKHVLSVTSPRHWLQFNRPTAWSPACLGLIWDLVRISF